MSTSSPLRDSKPVQGVYRRDMLVVILAVFALTLPFVNQSFHLDDREFIAFAGAQLEHPFRFYLEHYELQWQVFDKFVTTHPPVDSSFIAAVTWLSGGTSETVLHTAFILFSLIAGISMYWLARRFCRHPLLAALLLLATPGFLVMSHTLRADLPALAFWLAATAVFIRAVERPRWLPAAALLLVVAVMTSYQALSLVPLLGAYLVLNRRFSWRNLLPLAAPLAAFGLFLLYFASSTGQLPKFSYSDSAGFLFGWQNLPDKGRAMLVFMGSMSVFPLALVPALLRKKRQALLAGILAAPLLALGVILPYSDGGFSLPYALLLAVPLFAGLAVLLAALLGTAAGLHGWLRRQASSGADFLTRHAASDDVFLGIWLLGVAVYVFLLLPYASVRYMLPLYPPLILIFVRGAEALLAGRRRLLPAFLGAAAVLSLSVAVPAAIADYRLAGVYPSLAEQFRNEYAGQRVWFRGEFGFRYYMERAGFQYYGAGATPQPGDIVIDSYASSTTGPDVLAPPVPADYSVVLSRTVIDDGFPLRIRNPWSGAGFYSHRIGPLPLAISNDAEDVITIYRLQW